MTRKLISSFISQNRIIAISHVPSDGNFFLIGTKKAMLGDGDLVGAARSYISYQLLKF